MLCFYISVKNKFNLKNKIYAKYGIPGEPRDSGKLQGRRLVFWGRGPWEACYG